MSTRLLTTPGKAHELRDDLESLWFVLLYQALHSVKHNKPPEIQMDIIFDQVRVCPTTGVHTGGLGKTVLYFSGGVIIDNRLDFGNEPFNTLIRKVYQPFQALNTYYTDRDGGKEEEPDSPVVNCVRKLDSCAEIERLFREALATEGWPESCDKVQDNYPPKKHLTPEEKDTIALGYVNSSFREPGEPSGTKRKREEEEEEEEENPPTLENKRIKVDPLWKRIWSKCTGFLSG